MGVSAAQAGTLPREGRVAGSRLVRRVGLGRLAAIASGLAYLGFAAFITWPLALHLGTDIYGGGGDTWGSLAYWREITDGGINPFLPGTIPDFAAPGGLAVQYPLNIATWPSASLLYGLTWSLGPVAGVNVFVLSGYVLSGLAMYAFVVRLVGDRRIAFIAGWAFAFCPYAVVRGAGHWQFVHTWPLVLIAWRMLVLIERPSLRQGLISGAVIAFAMSWTPYYVLFGAVMLLALVPAGVLISARRGRLRAYVTGTASALALVGLTLLIYKLIATTTDATGERTNTLAQIWYAYPLQYLIPHPDNLLFGDWARDIRLRKWGGTGETIVYLGWSVLALAAVGLVAALRGRTGRSPRAFVLALVLVILAALAFSTPPYIVDSQIKMPIAYLYDVTTAWRVVIRLAIVITLCLCVFMSVGLAAIVSGRRTAVQVAVLVAVFAIVTLDLWSRTPHPVAPVPAPAVYEVLRDAPQGIVAEYPIQPAEEPEYSPMLYQDLHGKPLLNGFSAHSTEEEAALALQNLADPAVPPRLALRGVRYVVVNDAAPIAGQPFPAGGVKGLRFMATGEGRSIYAVDAKPAAALFGPAEGMNPPDPVRWIKGDSGALTLRANCRRCVGRVDVRLTSFGRQRQARLTAGGAEGSVAVAPGREVLVSLEVRFDRDLRIEISGAPGAQSIGETLGNGDPRTAGIGVAGATFTPAGDRRPSAAM